MTQPNTIPRFRPVIRVFVSSTFSDLKPERNALQALVFPRLEQLCAQNGFQFQAIDLRWGVSSEAGLDHRTMRICFDELRRAQDISPEPNFLVLLGNRYGWRPLPEEISQVEFEKLTTAANSGDENQTPLPGTHGKTARQVLGDWYRRDENVVLPDPPETSPDRAPLNYILQPRTQNLGDGRDYTRTKDGKDTQDWMDVQQVLWRIINAAFPAESLDHRFERMDWAQHIANVNDRQHPRRAIPQIARFQAAATEQEIWCGALSAANAERHVIACFREIGNRDDFTPADANDFFDLTESGQFDAASAARQSALKEAIRQRLRDKGIVPIPFSRLKREDGKVIVDTSAEDIRIFCDSVENQLRPIIERQFEEYWKKTAQASAERAARELKIEQVEHERFGRERGGVDSFVGREVELQAIRDYLRNDLHWPLVVHGASGCGKTALLARATEEIQKSEGSCQKPEVLLRFIGVTPRSSDIRSLLGSLCQELRLRHPREGELPTDTKALSEELQEHLQSATAEQPLILFLDALDQLSDADNGRLLNWLPAGQLPPNVKLVVSCLSDRADKDLAGQPFTELTRRQLIGKNSINLDVLSEAEARKLLFDRWLPQAGRAVSPEQRKRIEQRLASPACCQPIYLKLLFEEARLWHSYDATSELGESVPEILGQLIERLRRPENHHPLLVERVLGYLAASRHGLAENEILEVLFADPDYKAALDQATEQTRHELPASATRIPIAIWSRLRFDLAPYLTERAAPGANVLTIYHRQVAEWVQEQFVKTSEHSWQPHRRLADYFTACAKGTAVEWETDSVRGFAECVYQLIKAGQHEQAAGLLSNFPFLLHKLRVELLESVFEDYDLLRRETPARLVKQLEVWADFFREKAHILRRGNAEWQAHKILLQLAVEHADDSPLSIAAEEWLKENRCDWLWLRRNKRLKHAKSNPCIAVFEGHSEDVNGALETKDDKILSWSNDNNLRLWDNNGDSICVFEGHSSFVLGAIETTKGHFLSWSNDKTLRLWNKHGQPLAVFKGHADSIGGAFETKDGRFLSWCSSQKWGDILDNTLRLWDKHGRTISVLHGHTCWINGALETKDGYFLSWCGWRYQDDIHDQSIRIWNKNGEPLAVFDGHTQSVQGTLETNEGLFLSWSADKTLKLWNLQGECLAVFQGHSAAVGGAFKTKDGNFISWDANDTIIFWNKHGQLIEKHAGRFHGLIETRDGHFLSWSGEQKLRLWDKRGQTIAVLEAHADSVVGALETKDGHFLGWSHDSRLSFWDSNGRFLAFFHGHFGKVNGALETTNGNLLSWSSDATLRLWRNSGETLAILEGHAKRVNGGIKTHNGHLLSWADDGTLRMWDMQGQPLTIFKGHKDRVYGAIESKDGAFLSWSEDNDLRLWNQNGQLIVVLQGHHHRVRGALENQDRRFLSWADHDTPRLWDRNGETICALDAQSSSLTRILHCCSIFLGHTGDIEGILETKEGLLLSWCTDQTLRLWDRAGKCCAVFQGHSSFVQGAIETNDGQFISWSCDLTLRLWNPHGKTIAVFNGHLDIIRGAIETLDGMILSWSRDETARIWNQNGQLFECLSIDECLCRYPEFRTALAGKENSVSKSIFTVARKFHTGCLGFYSDSKKPIVRLSWHGDSDCTACCGLDTTGRAIVTQANGQVCFLDLRYGNRRASLADMEEILASQKKAAK